MEHELRDQVERITGHRFKDVSLLVEALTHPSYAAEHDGARTYDRLEFLGDAVLGFVVADEMFHAYPGDTEGVLTRRKHTVVAGEALAPAAMALGIGDLVLLGRGADAAGERERPSVLENALEALVGAIYVDGGLQAAREFVGRFRASTPMSDVKPVPDVKSLLQQRTQAEGGVLPSYRIVASEGPPHDRTYTAEVSVAGQVLGTGTGVSKQAAEKAAAACALAILEEGGRQA